ncbi:hypothetical protein [Streptomyces roseoverticillatus]|uniref:hypothetical protein n=1 Tax=Streptomyces roseoverticillatus TaxID=66429 RepID=UPI0004C1C830|nr:hypothetical protein [Streptomyces roseoverticillatus]
MYALHCNATNQAVWDSLPQPVSERLTLALAAACADPIAATEPYDEDDGIMRTLVLSDLFVVLYLGHQTKTLHIFQIDYLG